MIWCCWWPNGKEYTFDIRLDKNILYLCYDISDEKSWYPPSTVIIRSHFDTMH
jgi:hypothetical protein